MTQTSNLTVKAGTRAIEFLRDEGLDAERIHVLAGASGGPKWLVLSGMDLQGADLYLRCHLVRWG
jgi:hypothetical protein